MKKKVLEPQIFEETHMSNGSKAFSILQPDSSTNAFNTLVNDMQASLGRFRTELEYCTIKSSIYHWLIGLREETQHTYADIFTKFFNRKIIPETFADGKDFTVGGFRYIKHESVIDYIETIEDISNEEKQQWIECYKSFLSYLNDISYGWFQRIVLVTSSHYRISNEAASQSFTFSEWRCFIDILSEAHLRDSLIARCILQGTRRVSEVLTLTLNQIDFENNKITFKQKGKQVDIPYEKGFMSELKNYIEISAQERKQSASVFITRNGKSVTRTRLNYSFEKTCSQAQIKRISSESLRTLWVVLKQQGYSDNAIMNSKKARMIDKKKFERSYSKNEDSA